MPYVSRVKLVREHRSEDGSVVVEAENWIVSDKIVDGADTDHMRLFAKLAELLRPHTLTSKAKKND